MAISTVVFDAYGTLFDVAAAARTAAGQPQNAAIAEIWPQLANDWRLKQVQYTWLRAVVGAHTDFWEVTQNGLDWAMGAHDLSDDALRQTLLDLYWELDAYAEVPAMLTQLKAAGLNTAILSNGSPAMLDGAVMSAGIADVLDAVLSVESVGVFKPNAKVYQMVEDHFGCTRDQVLFVSSNGWDAAGASGFGFQTAWVNRAGDPQERLPWTPHHELQDLTSIPNLVGAQA